MGDFNAIRDASDRVGSSNGWLPSFDEFGICISQAGLEDLRYVGHRFTWSTSSGPRRKLRKIDRVLINAQWSRVLSFSEATFLAPGVSDHSPMIIRIAPVRRCRKPFKFFTFWMSHPSYASMVTQVWSIPLYGTPMFILCRRLKILKVRLKQLNKDAFSDISVPTSKAQADLTPVQDALVIDPLNQSLADQEKTILHSFSALRLSEESFYRQKSRIKWLKDGDLNTKFFHHSVNKRHLQNRLLSVTDSSGILQTDPPVVQELVVSYYTDLLAAPPMQPPCSPAIGP